LLVSLRSIIDGKDIESVSSLDFDNLIDVMVRGGFPASLDVSDDNKEDKPLNDIFKKEKISESLKNNIANIKEKSLDRARDVIASQVGDDSLLDSKGRKLCILVGVLLVIFL